MEEMKIRQIRGVANPDGTWALEIDVIEPDDTHIFPDGIRKTYHLPSATMSTVTSKSTFVMDF